MGFFNKKQINGFKTGIYICDKCGSLMQFEDSNEGVLICKTCGCDISIDHYGFTDDEYENLYPTLDEVLEEGEWERKKQNRE